MIDIKNIILKCDFLVTGALTKAIFIIPHERGSVTQISPLVWYETRGQWAVGRVCFLTEINGLATTPVDSKVWLASSYLVISKERQRTKNRYGGQLANCGCLVFNGASTQKGQFALTVGRKTGIGG